MEKVIYFQPNVPDPVLKKQIVQSIVNKYVKNIDIDSYFIDEIGGEARTYSINNKIILKVQRPHRLRNKTSLKKEVFFLKQLEQYKKIKVPYVFGYGVVNDSEYICMSKVSGKPLRYLNISSKHREDILFDLGKSLFKIHSLNKQPFLDSKLFPIDKDIFDIKNRLNDGFNKELKELKDISESEIKYASNLREELLNKITRIDKFVPLHSNPATSHTYVNDEFIFSGLIDFGDAFISHPIFDLKRWDLIDRLFVLKGYFYAEKPNDNFVEMLNIINSLDNIIEILKSKKTILRIKNVNDLISINDSIITKR